MYCSASRREQLSICARLLARRTGSVMDMGLWRSDYSLSK
jgi:hypothetical protein